MPIYELECDDCGHIEEFYCSFSEWDKCKEGKTPFPKKCPSCKGKNFHRVFSNMIFSATSSEQRGETLKHQIKEDLKRVAKGDQDFLRNLTGDKPISGNAGVKRMSDVKKGAFKRR